MKVIIMVSGREEKIKFRILIPIGLAIFILLGVSVVSIYRFQEQSIKETTQMRLVAVQKAFEVELKKDAELFNGLIDIVEQDQQLQSAWLAEDREALLRQCKLLFKGILSEYRVTHFCIHSLDQPCFLCVHDFPRCEGRIERHILEQVKKSGQPAYGIEIGPFGTFTLRVVNPWRINGEVVGYFEFGEEIEHITPELKRIAGSELFFTANKSHLDRAWFEKTRQVCGHSCQWDKFANFVIIDRTMKGIPAELDNYLKGIKSCTEQKHLSCLFKMAVDGRNYCAGLLPLVNAGSSEIGDIIVLADVTREKASKRALAMVLVAVCTIISILLFTILYFYIDRIEKRLTGAYSNLRTEVKNRKCLEKEILDVSEREQRRIGQELHDSVGQQFAGIAFMAKVLEQKLSGEHPREAASAAEIARLVNQAMEHARDLAKGLHPVDLDAGNFIPALQELTSTTEHLFGVRCTFSSDRGIIIKDTEVAVHLYRITQEAIVNAIKHGRSKNIEITLRYGPDRSILTAKSDGLDFPEVVEESSGMGLHIMRHRAEIIDGLLYVRRSPESGTILTCIFSNKNNGEKTRVEYVSEETAG